MSTRGLDPKQALDLLLAGNQRFIAGRATHSHQDSARRMELAVGQKPLGIVLTCSDSRVAPEILFDQGLGDIFVVRTAGNVADDIVLGSIEYAVEHLGCRLILVLGHDKCGAVTAAAQSGEAPGHIASIVSAIRPAVEAAKGQDGNTIKNAVLENVRLVVRRLIGCPPILDRAVNEARVQVNGAVYELETGAVSLVPLLN